MKKSLPRQILEHLHKHGSCTTPDLEIRLGVGRGGLSSALARLESNGFVRREESFTRGGKLRWHPLRPPVELREMYNGRVNNGSLGLLAISPIRRPRVGKKESRDHLRERLAADIKAFKANGGKITVVHSSEAPPVPRAGWVREGR